MKSGYTSDKSPKAQIDQQIAELGDWRGETLAKMRALIHEADPSVVEEVKWLGTPCWYHAGKGICTGETYKAAVKLTFFQGASLKDPAKLFNSSMDGNVRRAIDLHEGEKIDTKAFKALVKEAVALIDSAGEKKASPKKAAPAKKPAAAKKTPLASKAKAAKAK